MLRGCRGPNLVSEWIYVQTISDGTGRFPEFKTKTKADIVRKKTETGK